MNGLEINDLSVTFKTFRLDATLQVPQGCITGLIGRNGAGKSTLIKAIMRQQEEMSGSILYDGLPFKGNEREILSKIACVFDSPHFNVFCKAEIIIKFYRKIFSSFDMELCRSLMEQFSLPLKQRVRDYSLGMQKKFCLILALCQKPSILLLDEPTSGIDPYDRGSIVELIQQFMLDETHTVLFSTHITEDLDKIADYIAIMQEGKIDLFEQKDALLEEYRLVQCPYLTEKLQEEAIGVRKSMFGYTFLTKNREPEGEDILVKSPTVEEFFIHFLGEEEQK